jgi:4-hydroxy-tetrahydrodipicolinate synthase
MFPGAYTAIVTPFDSAGQVDYDRLRALIDLQVEAGMDGIVPVGTTGESPTVSTEEHNRIIEVAVETARGRIKVIAGTGANSTAEALELTRHAQQAGADGTLQVTPYYNKPSQEGLYRHFSTIADLGLPVILYNVPGRSAREIEVETIVRLSRHSNIVAVKEAAGSVERVSQILRRCDILVLSGDDSLTLPMMVCGAKGVISVASNVVPAAVAEMVHLALDGRWEEARQIHRRYYPLFSDLFLDTNPVPVKAAMALVGLIPAIYRLPLCETTDSVRAKLTEDLKELGLL